MANSTKTEIIDMSPDDLGQAIANWLSDNYGGTAHHVLYGKVAEQNHWTIQIIRNIRTTGMGLAERDIETFTAQCTRKVSG